MDLTKKAGEVHKKVRQHVLQNIKPNMKLIDIANMIESKIDEFSNKTADFNNNIAFPTGLSINNCAAHYTPFKEDATVLKYDDLIKIDYGVHFDGYIVDSAFSFSFSDKHNKLIEASKEATTEAIKMMRPDQLLSDIGKNTQEIIESYGYKSVEDLCGHSIGQYIIHSGQAIPNINFPKYTERVKNNQVYAVETFASTGNGRAIEPMNLSVESPLMSHFAIKPVYDLKKSIGKKERQQLESLKKQFGTLPFCKRWISNKSLKQLVSAGIVEKYPPLYDCKDSYVSQYEHTIIVGESKTEIVS